MSRPGPSDLVEAVRASGVTHSGILEAMAAISRAGFVPPEQAGIAYLDQPIPIPHHQVTTQPSLSARMIEALELTPDSHALEVGTGYGFQTALLARLAARVTSIERWPDLAAKAKDNLQDHGFESVDLRVGDGSLGVPDAAPFDAILVSAAFPEVPNPLVDQLREGGRLVQPIGPGGSEMVTLFRKTGERLKRVRTVVPARFVPLVGAEAFPVDPEG